MLAPSEARVESKTKKLARRGILKKSTIKEVGRGVSSTGTRKVNRERLCRGEAEAMVGGPRGGGGNSRLKKAMEKRGGAARGINGEIVYIERGPDTRREGRNDAVNGQEEEGSTRNRALGHTLGLTEGGTRRSDPNPNRTIPEEVMEENPHIARDTDTGQLVKDVMAPSGVISFLKVKENG